MKMAATGDEAAAMDNISKSPAVYSGTPNPTGGSKSYGDGSEEAAESQISAPKKASTNSEPCSFAASVAC